MRLPILLATFLAVPIVPASGDEIIGVAWPSGVYRIESTTGTGQFVGSQTGTGFNSLARALNGQFYSVDGSGNLTRIDPATGAGTVVTALNFGNGAPNVPSLAFSPSGVLFAISRESPDTLYTVNTATGTGTRVGATGGNFIVQGLAFSPGGTLYGWDINSGLIRLDVSTGVATDVNPSEGATASIQCLAFSTAGVLHGAQYGLFTIDPATGVPAAVGSTGLSDIRGMDFNTGPALRLTIAPVEGGLRICVFTEVGKTYQMQRRNRFAILETWENIGPAFFGTGADVCVTNPPSLNQRYFRIEDVTP